jgi:hypothetical protein
MQIPVEIEKAVSAAETAKSVNPIELVAEAQREELTVVAFLKQHRAQIIGGVVFCVTLFAVFLLTRK